MFLLLKYTLLYTVVLMMVALGGMFSERSGIINIALEGIMVIGGLMGVIAIQMMPPGRAHSPSCWSPFSRRALRACCMPGCWRSPRST